MTGKAYVQHPPQHMFTYDIKSTVFHSCWYNIMRRVPSLKAGKEIYSISLDSLCGRRCSCAPFMKCSSRPCVWRRRTDISSRNCCPAVFGSRLIAVTGGKGSYFTTTSLCAYSFFTKSWVHVGDTADSMWSYAPCAVVLPSNELMIVRGYKAFKITINSKFIMLNEITPLKKQVL